MSVNDSCRFCKVNLRSQGILGGTRPIFPEKATSKNGILHSRCLKLGLILQNTSLRSNRACSKCYRIISRMARNIDCLNGWRKRESKNICEGEGANNVTNDRRHNVSVPTSSSSSESSMSSMTEVSMIRLHRTSIWTPVERRNHLSKNSCHFLNVIAYFCNFITQLQWTRLSIFMLFHIEKTC